MRAFLRASARPDARSDVSACARRAATVTMSAAPCDRGRPALVIAASSDSAPTRGRADRPPAARTVCARAAQVVSVMHASCAAMRRVACAATLVRRAISFVFARERGELRMYAGELRIHRVQLESRTVDALCEGCVLVAATLRTAARRLSASLRHSLRRQRHRSRSRRQLREDGPEVWQAPARARDRTTGPPKPAVCDGCKHATLCTFWLVWVAVSEKAVTVPPL